METCQDSLMGPGVNIRSRVGHIGRLKIGNTETLTREEKYVYVLCAHVCFCRFFFLAIKQNTS